MITGKYRVRPKGPKRMHSSYDDVNGIARKVKEAAILKVGNFRDSRISKSLIQGWDAAPDLTSVWPEGGKLDFS